MGLETGVTYIEDLDAANPIGAVDTLDECDDHIRNIKTAVQGSFPNLGAAAVTLTATEANLLDGATSTDISGSGLLEGVVNLVYPVGSIYISTSATNPGTTFGVGTWAAYGAGRTIVGEGGSFSGTGGSANAPIVNHTHTWSDTSTGNSTNHTHTIPTNTGSSGSGTRVALASGGTDSILYTGGATVTHTHDVSGTTANPAGGVSATNANMPPYITTYIWQRTA